MSYEFWERSLAGERMEMYPDHPQSGFYKARFGGRDAPYVPVAIWIDAGQWCCKIGYDDLFNMRDARDVWTWCCGKPISYATYRAACRTHSWPSTNEDLGSLLDAAHRAVTTSEDGGELESLFQKLEVERKKANAEHLDAKRMVDSKFKQVTEQLKQKMKDLKQERQ